MIEVGTIETNDIVVCPSGLSGRIRKMKAGEARKVWQRNKSPKADPFGDLIKACWLETIDFGPYTPTPDNKLDWSKVMLGERLNVLNAIRMHTLGTLYGFEVNCERCGELIDWTVDLDQLDNVKMSEEDLETFAVANRFETMLPGAGVKVWFKTLLGEDEARLAQIRRRQKNLDILDLVRYQILEIEGVEIPQISKFIEDLDWSDVVHLWNTIQTTACGLDTRFDIQCPACNAIQKVDLPFAQTYFIPKMWTPMK